MPTGTQKKPLLGLKGALVVLVLLAGAAYAVSVKGKPEMRVTLPSDDDLHTYINVAVMFTPQKRTRTVQVQVHVEGTRIIPPPGSSTEYLPLLQSPWNSGPIRVPKGVQVSAYAFQDEAPKPGNLDIMIQNKNGTLSHGYRSDPGSVRAFVNRVGG